MSEWISVKDRIPEEYGHYLCYSEREQVHIFSHHSAPYGGLGDNTVTHWMPLPKAPKKAVRVWVKSLQALLNSGYTFMGLTIQNEIALDKNPGTLLIDSRLANMLGKEHKLVAPLDIHDDLYYLDGGMVLKSICEVVK